MKKEIYRFELPSVLKVFCIVVAMVLLFMAAIFFHKQNIITFIVFLLLGIMLVIATTYKRIVFFEKMTKKINICKTYLGLAVSNKKIVLDSQSVLKLFVEKSVGRSSMGYTEVSGFLTLSITGFDVGKNKRLHEFILCSEHQEEKKPEFLEQVKEISQAVGISITEK